VNAWLARRLMGLGAVLLAASVQPTNAIALSCVEAAAAAEADAGLPRGLLLAIGNVESGRTDAAGLRAPWPWTINTAGTGRFFATASEAILAVTNLRASGVQSIDIGCFQINLFHHPEAFPDLAAAFDPLANAHAAANFLISLRGELGGWEQAIAAYHSRVDLLGAPYRDRVLALWHGAPLAGGTRFAGIRVWGPAGEITFGADRSFALIRLPRVVTASVR